MSCRDAADPKGVYEMKRRIFCQGFCVFMFPLFCGIAVGMSETEGPGTGAGYHACPDCSGTEVVVTGTFHKDTDCFCLGTQSITLDQGALIQDGASVTLQSPQIQVRPGATIEPGANVHFAARASEPAYDIHNNFKDVLITRIEADYVPSVHNETDQNSCQGSSLELRFTLLNTGQKAISRCGPLGYDCVHILWRINMQEEPWPETGRLPSPSPTSWMAWECWYAGCSFPETINPGESVDLSFLAFKHGHGSENLGKWHPFVVEARLVIMNPLYWPYDYRYVGRPTPVKRSFNLSLPDVYIPPGSIGIVSGKVIVHGTEHDATGGMVTIALDGGAWAGGGKLMLMVGPDPEKVEEGENAVWKGRFLSWDIRFEGNGTQTILLEPRAGGLPADLVYPGGWYRYWIHLCCPIHGYCDRYKLDADPSNNSRECRENCWK